MVIWCLYYSNFDLCQDCEKNDNSGFPLLKINKSWQAPVKLVYRPYHRFGRCHSWRRHPHGGPRGHARGCRHRNGYAPAPPDNTEQGSARNASQVDPPSPSPSVGPNKISAEEEAMIMQAIGLSLATAIDSTGEKVRDEDLEALLEATPVEIPVKGQDFHDADLVVAVPVEADEKSQESSAFESNAGLAVVHSGSISKSSEPSVAPVPEVTKAPAEEVVKAPAEVSVPVYDAVFVEDSTIPDGTILPPGACFEKVWKLRNSGNAAFPEGTKLVFFRGHIMEGPIDGVPVPSIPPGEEFIVKVTLTAPSEDGQYIGHWNLQTPTTERIGHRIWVQIQVDAAEAGWEFIGMAEGIKRQDQESSGSEVAAESTEEHAPRSVASSIIKSSSSESSAVVVKEESVSSLSGSSVAASQGVAENEVNASPRGGVAQTVQERAGDISEWEEQIQTLYDMGFEDIDRSYYMLKRFFAEGGLERVIEALLQ